MKLLLLFKCPFLCTVSSYFVLITSSEVFPNPHNVSSDSSLVMEEEGRSSTSSATESYKEDYHVITKKKKKSESTNVPTISTVKKDYRQQMPLQIFLKNYASVLSKTSSPAKKTNRKKSCLCT